MTVVPTREQPPQVVRTAAPGGAARRPFFAGPGGPHAAAGPVAGLTGRDALRIIRKRKWMILLSLTICVGLASGATVLWLMYAPLYTSAALMEVRPQLGTPLGPGSEPQQAVIDTFARTYVNLIQSESVLGRAVENERVKSTAWFRKEPATAMRRLQDDISVAPIPTTKLIRISMTGFDARELPEIINAVAQAGQADALEAASRGTQEQIAQLLSGRANLIEQRDRNRKEKAQLLHDADVPDMRDRSNVLTQRLQALDREIRIMEGQLTEADGDLKLIQEQVKNGTIGSLPDVLRALDADPVLRSAQAALLNSETERGNLLRKFGPRHRSVLNFEARMAALKQQVDKRTGELLDIQVRAMVTNAEAKKAIILTHLAKLREDQRLVDRSLRDLAATLSRYDNLTRAENDMSESIARIDSRVVELGIALKGDAPLVLRRSAFTPDQPSHPKWSIMVPLGVVLGLVVGFGLAFLLEFVDTSVKGPGDVARRIDLPLLGMVPYGDDLEEEIDDLRLAFASHPNSLLSEAFRQVRTCLLFSAPAGQRRTLLVTSPLPEDGRTTVTMNLAASVARGGRKVLVVDANFRQPALKRLFPQCPDGGLSSALVGQAAWRDQVLEVEPNLHVLGSGPLPPNPAELLGSDQMSNLIADMLGDYDQVLFDGAPCLLVTDAPALSTLVDGVLLVVRAGANTFGIVHRAREMLNRIGAQIVGVVLNGVRTVAGGYLRKNYDAFYEYQERSRLPQK